MRAPLRFILIMCFTAVGVIARADSTEPGKPWQRPGSTVLKVVLCEGLDSAGQPRHPGQKFTVAQRAVVLVVDANPKGDMLTYEVVLSREGKTVLQKSWHMDCPLRRIFIFSSHTAAHLPIGSYQAEVHQSGLAVWRIPFVITAAQ